MLLLLSVKAASPVIIKLLATCQNQPTVADCIFPLLLVLKKTGGSLSCSTSCIETRKRVCVAHSFCRERCTLIRKRIDRCDRLQQMLSGLHLPYIRLDYVSWAGNFCDYRCKEELIDIAKII